MVELLATVASLYMQVRTFGPLGTTFVGTYLAIDGSSATATDAYGWSGAGYLDAAGDGFCSVDFLVMLAP